MVFDESENYHFCKCKCPYIHLEWIVRMMQGMYANAQSRVRVQVRGTVKSLK